MRVGVLSDTHLGAGADVRALDRIVSKHFAGVDVILHAGDLTNLSTIENVLAGRELIAVAGNMDDAVTQASLPGRRIVPLGSARIGLIHGWGEPAGVQRRVADNFKGEDVDCVVYGHSHQPFNQERGGVLYFNPGSPTDRRFATHRSVGVLDIAKRVTGRVIPLKDEDG